MILSCPCPSPTMKIFKKSWYKNPAMAVGSMSMLERVTSSMRWRECRRHIGLSLKHSEFQLLLSFHQFWSNARSPEGGLPLPSKGRRPPSRPVQTSAWWQKAEWNIFFQLNPFHTIWIPHWVHFEGWRFHETPHWFNWNNTSPIFNYLICFIFFCMIIYMDDKGW